MVIGDGGRIAVPTMALAFGKRVVPQTGEVGYRVHTMPTTAQNASCLLSLIPSGGSGLIVCCNSVTCDA